MYKQFDPALFESNDARARAAVLGYIQSLGLHCVENPDKYGPDLVLYSGFRKGSYIEVECKLVWRAGTEFQWDTLQIPERKGKFMRLGLPIEFWILREDLLAALVIPEESLSKAPLVEVANKLVPLGEKFYRVPVIECEWKDLSNAE